MLLIRPSRYDFYGEVGHRWKASVATVRNANESKAQLLLLAQRLLFCAVLAVAALSLVTLTAGVKERRDQRGTNGEREESVHSLRIEAGDDGTLVLRGLPKHAIQEGKNESTQEEGAQEESQEEDSQEKNQKEDDEEKSDSAQGALDR